MASATLTDGLDGSLLVVSMEDQEVLRRDPRGSVSGHADLSTFTDSWLNDIVVGDERRAWVDCFGCDVMAFADPQCAPLMRVDPHRCVADNSLTA